MVRLSSSCWFVGLVPLRCAFHFPLHDSWLRSLSPLRVGDASGSAGGRWFSSSASRRPGWSSVVTTVMKVRARWSVTRFRSRLPRVVRVRRSWVGDRSRDACPRMRAQDDQALRAGWSQHRPAGQQGHQEREARDAAQDEQRHDHNRQAPAEQHKATTPEATAPRSGSPSGRTRRAQERAPASHREERQAANPTKAAQLTQRGRRPSSSDTRSEASRITCETRAEGRTREPTAWGRGARGRFLGRPVSPE